MSAHPLHEEAIELLEELCAKFPLKTRPSLVWKPYRTTAGMAHLDTWSISLGIRVIIDSQRLRDTLIHEYAHLLAVHRDGMRARGHGPAWRRAMMELGAEPEVHHRYECQRNRPRQVVRYRCQRCRFEFTRSRRLARRRTYVHRECGGKIAFVGVESAIAPDEAA